MAKQSKRRAHATQWRSRFRPCAVLAIVATLCSLPVIVVAGPASAATTAPATSPNSPASPAAKLPTPGPATLPAPAGAPNPATPSALVAADVKLPGLPASAPKVATSDSYTAFTHTATHNDGSATVEVSAKPAHYQDAKGVWHDVDTTLVAAADGAYVAKAAATSAKVAAHAGSASVNVPTKAGAIAAGQSAAAPVAATVAGDQASFKGALGANDVAEKVTADGYEETITIAAPGGPSSYTDQFTLPAGVTARNGGLGVEFVDSSGSVVASFGGVKAEDSAAGPSGGAVAPGTARVATTNGNVVTVDVSVDAAWASDPARVYPISLDPTMTTIYTDGSSSYDGYVDGDYPTSNYGWTDPELAAGYAGPASSGGSYARTLLYFALGGLAGSGAAVSEAHLAVDNQHSWVCNPPGSQINLVGVASHFDFSTTWNTQPGLDGYAYTTSAPFSFGDTCGGAGWVNLDATALVQRWLNVGGEANNGLELNGVYQGDEMNNYGWKEFWSERGGPAPALVVNYTPAAVPGPPTNVVATVGNATATVSWVRPANAGTPALDGYYLYAYNYPAMTLAGSAVVGSGTTSSTGPATNGQAYVWAVYAHNAKGFSPAAWSNVVTPAAPPSTPQNVVGNGGNTAGAVRWAPPASSGGVPEDLYLVALYDLGTNPATLVSYFTVCGTCTFTPYPGLVNGHAYEYAVWGHNGPGGYGQPSLSNIFSSSAADPMAGAGDRSYFSYQSFALDDRMAGKVNIGTGDLQVSMTDLAVPMVGGGLSLTRTYNSMEAALGARVDYSGQFGYLWSSNQTPDVRLVPTPDPGTVMIVSPTGGAAIFVGTAGASSTAYTTPPGLDSTLARNATDGTYTLTVHASQEVLRFGADGQLLSDTDANGNALTFTYADGRREASIVGTAGSSPGNTISFVYGGPAGQISSVSQTAADVATRTVSYTYNPSNDAINQVTDPSGRVTTFQYDANNNLSKITVKANSTAPDYQVTTFGYDSSHRVTSVDRAISNPTQADAVWRYDYSTPGQTKVTDADGHPPVVYAIDGFGRATSVADPKNAPKAATTTFTSDYKVATVQGATNWGTGLKTVNDWSANGGESLTSSTNPILAVTANTFLGPMAYLADKSDDSMDHWTKFTYGPNVNTLTATDPVTGAMAITLHNPDGTVALSADPNNTTQTDPLHPETQPPAKSTTFAYFPTHQLSTVTPPTGNSLATQSFTYDGVGRLKTARSGNGVTTTYTYDALDRVSGETFSDATHAVTLGYDTLGNPSTRSDASGQTSWSYDTANRLQTKTLPGGAQLIYQYDSVGNLTFVNDGGVITRYQYDKVNELDQVLEPSGRYDVFAYDADHRRTDTWYGTPAGVVYDASGNNVVAPASFAAHIHSAYDPAGNLAEIRTTRASSDAPANRLADISYAYIVPGGSTCATAGKVTTLRQTSTDVITNAVTSYCYDSAGRLTQAAAAGGPTYTYVYDRDGNRILDAAGTHTFNTANQLTDTGYVYDPDGNLTASPAISALAYNGVDQTTSMTKAGIPSSFAYAGTGQAERTSAGSTTAQNGALGVETETTAGATTTYVRDPSGTLIYEHTPAAGDFYYYFDGLGSVVGLVNPAGQQRAAYTYDPYGSNATATAVNGSLPSNPWRFTGGYFDAATGLYHLGARYYDPTTGRFTQPEGTGYLYVGDNPVNGTDLSGAKKKKLSPDEEARVAATIDGCVNTPDIAYSNSSFCINFITAWSQGDLTDYGFGFVPKGSSKCSSFLRTAAGLLGVGGYARAAQDAAKGNYSGAVKEVVGTKWISGREAFFLGRMATPLSLVATAVDSACSINP